MISRVRVQGYKCLEDVEVRLGPFNVLIGLNDAGKSSFMQAVAEPSRALLRRQPTDVHRVSAGGFTVELEGETGTLTHDASHFHAPKFAPPEGRQEQLSFLSQQQAAYWFGKHPDLASTDPVALDPGPIASDSPATHARLDHFVSSRGAGTAAHLAALALGDRDRFNAVEAATREVTRGRIRSIVVKDLGGSTYALAFKLVDGTVVPAAEMSQGILLFVGFQALIQRDPIAGVLLIEEPERGLHPRRLFELVATLRGMSQHGTQVILTTHSPDLLNACQPSEVRIFHRPEPESPTEVHMLPPDFEYRASAQPLGHLWAARGEEGLLVRGEAPGDSALLVDASD